MSNTNLHRLLFLFVTAGVAVAAACSGSDATSSPAPTGTDGGSTADGSTTPLPDGGVTQDATTTPQAVTFSYHPSWKGVQSVQVIGGFTGTSADWTTPFATLTDDGTGTWKGTGAALANGKYTYLYKVTGDSAAATAKQATFPHTAIDPANSQFEACPVGAPTYSKTEMNPCSDLIVPQGAADPTYHAKGLVQLNGAPIGGYLVLIERIETGYHHFFADLTTSMTDGTFDLPVAAGMYRFQVLHPTYESMTDAQRTSPETYAAVRRSISSSTMVTADFTADTAEVGYADYALMDPRGTTTLPTTFTFGVPTGTKVHAQVYGPTPTIGDPWWVATPGVVTSDEFDGGFNTDKAADGGINPDASYFWGTEQAYPKGAGAIVSWTAESMVYPVKWQ